MSLSGIRKKTKFLNYCVHLANNIIKYRELIMQSCSHCILSEQECIILMKSDHCSVCMLSRFWHVSTGCVTGLSVKQRKCCSELSVMT